MKMQFTAFIIMLSLLEGKVPKDDVDAGLLQQVEDTYGQCLRIVDAVGELDDDLYETRRRAGDVAFNATSKLKLCAAMVERSQTFARSHFSLTRFFSLWKPSERSFLKDLIKQVGKKMGDTLYVASLDGDSGSKFHDLCDGQGPTVVVVETTAGVIFGGYNGVSWMSNGGGHESKTAFLYQIRPSMIKFSGKSSTSNVVFYHVYGPTFGGGHDLYIASGATSNNHSYTSRHTYGMNSRYQLNNGVRSFQVKDYVVLRAVPL